MNSSTANRINPPSGAAHHADTDEIRGILLAKRAEGAVVGAGLGAFLGAFGGALLAWLFGGVGWKCADKWLGVDYANMGGEAGALIGAWLALSLCEQSFFPRRDTLFFYLAALVTWILLRLVGMFLLGWEIAGTGFSWGAEGLVIGALGGARAMARHLGEGGALDPAPTQLSGFAEAAQAGLSTVAWILQRILPGAVGTAVGAALAGAVGAALIGLPFGVISGDLGKATIAAPWGAAIGAALLGAAGGAAGGYLSIRRFEQLWNKRENEQSDHRSI